LPFNPRSITTHQASLSLLFRPGKRKLNHFVQVMVALCLGAFAAGCLIRGAMTGRMFCFFSLMMFGDASRKGNPAWFWAYGLINVVTVLAGLLTLSYSAIP